MRNGHENAVRGASNTSCGVTEDNESTEDIWSEDKYIPDAAYLPSPPDIRVNVSAIQPQHHQLEPKHEMDETWDYDYETPPAMKRGISNTVKSRPCNPQLDKNRLTLASTQHLSMKCGRVSPAFSNYPNGNVGINGNRSPRFQSACGSYTPGHRPPLGLLRPIPPREFTNLHPG